MSFEEYVAIGMGICLLVLIAFTIYRFIPKRLKPEKYSERWRQIQRSLPDSSKWAMAIIDADDLLIEALKKKRYKGKNPGERLVSAQKKFTNNDAVWFGHKLRTKLESNPDYPLKKEDVQQALLGLRQALKDIGALR